MEVSQASFPTYKDISEATENEGVADHIDGHSGLLMNVEVYEDCVTMGYLMDHDGYGNPVKAGKLMRDNLGRTITIIPSWCPRDIPRDATHILWYNK